MRVVLPSLSVVLIGRVRASPAADLTEEVLLRLLEDFTSDQTALDRDLAQLSSRSQVDGELAKMKAELGSGAEKKEL